MNDLSVADAIANIYVSIGDDNRDLDLHIAALKAAMAREGLREAPLEVAKLAQRNRQGRKLLQAYFRQRGVAVTFAG